MPIKIQKDLPAKAILESAQGITEKNSVTCRRLRFHYKNKNLFIQSLF